MRVPTNLRAIRTAAALTLTEVEDLTGVNRAVLSQIETGRMLPADKHVGQLELAYGPAAGWYDAEVLLLIQRDGEDSGE